VLGDRAAQLAIAALVACDELVERLRDAFGVEDLGCATRRLVDRGKHELRA
jgi:hypothetical protein